MSIIVAGVFKVPEGELAALRPAMQAMLAATRAEDGCIEYAYGFDAVDAGLVRVFELWRDATALEAHVATAHMSAWRAAGQACGVFDRNLAVYEIASQRPA
jgi:quinol monooxygenase YgiN